VRRSERDERANLDQLLAHWEGEGAGRYLRRAFPMGEKTQRRSKRKSEAFSEGEAVSTRCQGATPCNRANISAFA